MTGEILKDSVTNNDSQRGPLDDLEIVSSMQIELPETGSKKSESPELFNLSSEDLSSSFNALPAIREELLSRFPQFKEVSYVGDGATGTVVNITTNSGQNLAGKLVSIIEFASRAASNSSLREAEVLKNLSHPALCTFHGSVSVLDGTVHMVLSDLAPGKSLKEHLAEVGEMPPKEVVALMKKVLNALDYLHNADSRSKLGASVIHRDIKPENIIISPDGDIKLIDFGGAHISGSAVHYSATTHTMGTPGYRPKEVMSGQGFPSSDLYSLGVTALKCLGMADPDTVRSKGLSQERTFQVRPKSTVPEKLRLVLQKMIEHKPADRFQSAEAVMAALEQSEIAEAPRDSLISLTKRTLHPLVTALHGSMLSAHERLTDIGKRLVSYFTVESIPILGEERRAGRETLFSSVTAAWRGYWQGIQYNKHYRSGITEHDMTPEAATIYAKLHTLASLESIDTTVFRADCPSEETLATFQIFKEGDCVITAQQSPHYRGSWSEYSYPRIWLKIADPNLIVSHEVSLPSETSYYTRDEAQVALETIVGGRIIRERDFLKYPRYYDSYVVELAKRLAGMASDTLANPNERLIRSEMFPERGALPENLDKLLFTDNVDRFVDKFLEYESNVAFLSFRGLREPLLMYKTLTPSFGSTLGNFCESSNKKLEEILRSIREHMVTTEYRGGDYVHYSDMRPGYAEHLPDLNDVITDVYKTFYQQLRTATDPIEVAAINEILNAYMSAVRPSET